MNMPVRRPRPHPPQGQVRVPQDQGAGGDQDSPPIHDGDDGDDAPMPEEVDADQTPGDVEAINKVDAQEAV